MVKITSADYDERIRSQGLQFQIDNYYEPKSAEASRRIEIVANAIDPGPGERILDMGCGVGTFAYRCARSGARSLGADYSLESIRTAKILCERFGVTGQAAFVVADSTALPFADSYFDKIVAADFIEHITLEDKQKMLAEFMRVLKPGGKAIIFTPNGIRELIGELYWKARRLLFGDKIPSTELHFGLTTRREFERLCRSAGFGLRLRYVDVTRPYLAHIPVLNRILALDLLWTITKEA